MENTTSRAIIETVVRKAIRDISDSPRRSTRNLVDMALNFAEGRFQKYFFRSAQKMLKNENSRYYDLVYDAVTHIDTDRIVTFGINLGYNSCTSGAKTIRKIEEEQGYHVPWSVTFMMDPQQYLAHQEAYQSAVTQGKQMGIYTWQMCAGEKPEILLPLVKAHADCAFILLCDPRDITQTFLDEISPLNNVMLTLRLDYDTAGVCQMLRERKLLYSVYFAYTAEDEAQISSGDLFYSAEQMHPFFTALTAARGCPVETREQVYADVCALRAEQAVQTVPWELTYDSSMIDGVISTEPCTVAFDSDGYLHIWHTREEATAYNLFSSDLKTLFKKALPKHSQNC